MIGVIDQIDKEDEQLLKLGKKLPVMEEFYSIQGEGYNVGRPSYFIRIGGCDVGCHWCDVKESWDPGLHPLVDIDKVVENAHSCAAKSVVITGGEPLLYNLDCLTKQLVERGVKVFLETSGAYPMSGVWHWICLSPKKNQPPINEVYGMADELKVIVYNKDDIRWAENHADRVNEDCHLFLQPEWSNRDKITPLLVEYIKNNPEWKISLQTHKYMQIP